MDLDVWLPVALLISPNPTPPYAPTEFFGMEAALLHKIVMVLEATRKVRSTRTLRAAVLTG